MGASVSVVIPAYQDGGPLLKCVASVLASDYQGEYEIIIVDDHSEPPLEPILPKDKHMKYIYQPERKGAAFARNTGAGKAGFGVIYFLDSDVEVYPDNMRKMSDYFLDPSIKAAIGLTHYEPINDSFMSDYQALFEYFIQYHPDQKFVNIFNTRNAAIRKDVFLSLGGLDASFGTTLEEAEFSQRMAKSGIMSLNALDVVVRHRYPSTIGKAVKNHFTRGFTWFRIYFKHKGATTNSGGTSPGIVKGIFMHFLFFAALFLSFFFKGFIYAAALFYALHLIYFRRFYYLCAEKKGLFFALRAMALKLIMSFTMGLSQVLSLISMPFHKKDVL